MTIALIGGACGNSQSSGGTGGQSDAAIVAGAGGSIGGTPADVNPTSDVASTDGDAVAIDALARSNKVLIYGVTTANAYRHDSIPAAAAAIAKAALAAGLTTEQVGTSNQTNTVDATKFSATSLAQYGAIILLATDGEPFGYPATDEIQNLIDYVHGGGALVGIECSTDCYGGAFSGPMDGHPLSIPYHMLLGANFAGHPGDLAPATCTKVGTHPSVAQLAPTFNLTDEIYAFSDLRMDNQVVLNCVSSTDQNTVRPVAWLREEGSGRVFYSALGHPSAAWTTPMDPNAESRLLEDHVMPGLLWAMQR